MFLIFVNDIQYACPELKSILFADDNSAHIHAENIEDLITKSNIELKLLFDWYTSNRLAIHPGKSRCMLFYPPSRPPNLPRINNELYFPLYLDYNDPTDTSNFSIAKIKHIRIIPNADEESFRVLGVLFDQHLSMKYHIRKIHSKITSAIFSLKQMKHLLDKKHLKLLVNAYIKSHIEYCCNTFCLCTDSIIKPITTLLKKAIRIICNKNPWFHANTLFKQEHILPVP